MKAKLTLSVDKELVHFARSQARNDGKSVSGIFSEYLLARKAQSEHQATPKVSVMVGSLKRYNIDDSKAAIRSSHAKKYFN
jgi:negative regulator of replication initiation